ncbi:branched-chain amino acid aminotransferase [Bartonella sp. HY406]|uniref:branched-chain amino acid aminotransferase n=1 Tax=Bartonella sp. HY406 TaxID=2979331 RepID=UPI0021C77C21|nr:branched-chain amino acid aminotransferase [Bartonella sp. HY406]UXN02334.1 branched-chain amino acid aminotransferase [Bartonella sp. HY406]
MATASSDLTFQILPNENPVGVSEREEVLKNPGFGKVFSDHMAVVEWSNEKGWHNARICARKPFEMDPAGAVLHYAQEIFEGMKAYRNTDGNNAKVTLFRPDQNAQRMEKSAIRMGMPALPENIFLEAVEQLVKIDKDWIPTEEDGSLYLRPFMFANESFLGVRPAHSFIFCVIASPVGAYFKGEGKPVSVWVEETLTRASRGGTGAVKCGGNYAASLAAQAKAYDKGCDQVVFLDAAEHRWVEELGGMNIFFVHEGNVLVTPPLTGTILPGITRASLIQLAHDNGFKVEERLYSFDEWKNDVASGKLKEVFACGTAAVITAIGTIRYEGGEFVVNNNETGEVTRALRNQLVHIQRGEKADPHNWVKIVA